MYKPYTQINFKTYHYPYAMFKSDDNQLIVLRVYPSCFFFVSQIFDSSVIVIAKVINKSLAVNVNVVNYRYEIMIPRFKHRSF